VSDVRAVPMDLRWRGGPSDAAGFTVIELLITTAIFVVVLASIGTYLIAGTRTYEVTGQRTEQMQDSEAVLQLLRYEAAMAGYRGISESTYDRPFTLGGPETLEIEMSGSGGRLTMRYFEDRFVGASDTGERTVTFYVDPAEHALVREEQRPGDVATVELMAGSVARMDIIEVVDRDRVRYDVDDIASGAVVKPNDVAGITLQITFTDGRLWEFLIGLSNPQIYSVSTN